MFQNRHVPTAVLLKEPAIIQNSSARAYSSFEYFAITIKLHKTLLAISTLNKEDLSN